MTVRGKVYLVGAGPGAPDLITLRAARLIERADVLFHDALVHPDVIALARHAQVISVGKRCVRRGPSQVGSTSFGNSTAQRFINKRLVDAAMQYAVVVRLKGGDPMLFGRAQEEIAALEAAGVPYEVVPGVTAATAASADLGTSLTQRGSARSFVFVTPRVGEGHDASEWVTPLRAADAGAIYMGVGQADVIAAALIASGMPASAPLVVVENASLPDSRRVHGTLAMLPDIAAREFSGPAIILVGPQFVDRSIAADVSALRSFAA